MNLDKVLTTAEDDDGARIPFAAEAAAVMLLANRDAGRLQRGFAAFTLAQSGYSRLKAMRARRRNSNRYSVTIKEYDELYTDALLWVMESLPDIEQRALIATMARDHQNNETRVQLFYDGSYTHTMEIDGHFVEITMSNSKGRMTDDDDGMLSADGNGSNRKVSTLREESVSFVTHSIEGRNAVIKTLQSLANKKTERIPRIFFAEKWGSWSSRGGYRQRSLDTVVLRDGQIEQLVEDLSTFIHAEEQYTQLGIPWHRGYLFHGPPGTGKTSLAGALAARFKLDVYFISLPSIQSDDDLNGLVRSVGERSILVLEDIDILHASHERDGSENQGVTLGGLLNVLDGMVTPHGLITVLTTNRLDVLDEALVRPGRADMRMELGYLDDQQLHEMWRRFTGEEPPEIALLGAEVTPAEVVGIFKQYISKPAEALDEVLQIIEQKRLLVR